MLAIEEEHCGRNEGDIKVLGIHRNTVHIHNVDIRHLGECMLVLGQLRKQQQVSSKTTQQTIPRYTWISTHSPFHLLPWLRNIFLERNNYLILGTHLSRKWPIMT